MYNIYSTPEGNELTRILSEELAKEIDMNIIFVDRSHNYSTTKLKNNICESLK